MNLRVRLIVVTILWLAATVVYGYSTVAAKLALPPTGDVYAHTVGFQVLSFVIFKGPSLISLLIVAVLSQVFLARARDSRFSTGATQLLLVTFRLLVAVAVAGMAWSSIRPIAIPNPYYWPGEQQLLQFAVSWLPLLAIVGAAVLMLEMNWLSKRPDN